MGGGFDKLFGTMLPNLDLNDDVPHLDVLHVPFRSLACLACSAHDVCFEHLNRLQDSEPFVGSNPAGMDVIGLCTLEERSNRPACCDDFALHFQFSSLACLACRKDRGTRKKSRVMSAVNRFASAL